MQKYVLFGAGVFGKKAISFLGKENIAFLLDNDPRKWGGKIDGINICSLDEMKSCLYDKRIIISVSEEKSEEIASCLRREGIVNFCMFETARRDFIRERIARRIDYISVYQRAIAWIKNHTANDVAIINNTDVQKPYPEVTGYYIPSLMRWGYRELAISFARWLCSIQKPDGSWYDTDDNFPYIFDSAQILKGLLAVKDILPCVKSHIGKGCDWILSNMQADGRLPSPRDNDFGDEKTFSELIHVYCLSPLVEAANYLNRQEYKENAYKILDYYIKNYHDKIMNFSLLSHFHAYVVEGLLDMGQWDLAYAAMQNINQYQTQEGSVPAYRDVHWLCSTGLFQYALIWFRLGELGCGNKAFAYACKLQNPSGGWYGSYLSESYPMEKNTYFPSSEISWAVKYFLDALYWKNRASFESQADSFKNTLSLEDGRYVIIEKAIQREIEKKNDGITVLDIGCGKGAYLKNLITRLPQNRYIGVDLSDRVMKYINHSSIKAVQGSLTNIPFEDELFDLVYACESLEHAVDIESAIREMARVTKKGGTIIIIDKNSEMLGYFEIDDTERWFDKNELEELMMHYCNAVVVETEVDYEQPANGLFYAWIGQKR